MSLPPSRTVSQTTTASTSGYSFNYSYKWAFSTAQQLTDISTLDKNEVLTMLSEIDAIITDCDGVLWIDTEPLPGSVEVINTFKELGKRVIFLTNNSTKTRDDLVIKAKRLGFTIEKQEVMSSASLVVYYLKRKKFHKKVYLIGSVGIAQEIEQAGIRHLGIGPDVIRKNLAHTVDRFHYDPEVGAVVVGFDEHFSYLKLLKAASYLNKSSCIFLATNKDEGISINSEIVLPGTGAILKSVETAAKKEAKFIGKPEMIITEALIYQYGIEPTRTLLIGDCCKTDILLGTRSGFSTLLVLSGLTKLDQVKAWKESNDNDELDLVPDYYVGKLGDLLRFLK